MESFIAHQAFNEGDKFTIWRPPRSRHLKRRFVDGCGVARRDVDLVNLRDPPVVVPWTWSGSCYERLVVGSPIVIVDVEILRRNLVQLARGNVQNSNPLIMNRGIDNASCGGGPAPPGPPPPPLLYIKGNLFFLLVPHPSGPRTFFFW